MTTGAHANTELVSLVFFFLFSWDLESNCANFFIVFYVLFIVFLIFLDVHLDFYSSALVMIFFASFFVYN